MKLATLSLLVCTMVTVRLLVASPAMAQGELSGAPVLKKVDGLTHGPQLGNVSSRSIRVWARMRRPMTFSVIYSTSPDLRLATHSKLARTRWEDDSTGWVELTDLKPATKYYYALVVDGRVADTRVNGHVNSFLTLPEASAYADPVINPKGVFNFAFEIGTGNRQGKEPIPPTYARMLAELKDRIYFQIQNGDWLYPAGRDITEAEWAAQNEVGTLPRSVANARGIAGVWNNYRLYLEGSSALANFYREVPLFVTIDDNEILNDIIAPGQTGLRTDARGKQWQKDLRRGDPEDEVELAVFRDPAVEAWRDYLGWANPDIGLQQQILFSETNAKAGSETLTDPNVDFRNLDLTKISNLHVLWGFGNTGVYRIAKVLGPHKIQIEPSLNVTEKMRYSIGTNLYSRFRVSNADFFLLDTRSNRTSHNKDNANDPSTTTLGKDQKAWLLDGLRKSDADFIFVVSPVNFAVPHDSGAWYGKGRGGPNKDDGWTAHLSERAEVLKVVESLGKPVFFMTGDLHRSYVVRIAPGVYDIATGPHTSFSHSIGDAGGAPPSGWFESGDRLVNVLWTSNQFRNDSGGAASERVGRGWPIYTVVKVNNSFNVPTQEGKARWLAYPEPQIIFEFRDGYSGELVFAHSVSTSEAKPDRIPVPPEVVKRLGGILDVQ